MSRWIASPPGLAGETFPFDARRFLLLAGIVLLGKIGWILVAGPSYEMDTATYLEHWITYHHPPLYGIFLQSLERIWPNVYFVTVVQALLFAAAAAWCCGRFGRSWRDSVLLAVALAVEPVTSFFCANLMSEALFLPLLMVWLILLSGYRGATTAAERNGAIVALALTGALLYSVRLAAVTFLGYFALIVYFNGFRIRRMLGHTLLLLLLTEALLVPVKLTYLKRYDSYSMSLFSGVNLWNNACVLYPGSSVRDNPRTEFERFLATRDTEEYTTANALEGNTIHQPWSGYHEFVTTRRMTHLQHKAFADRLGRTSKRIILENPLGYVRLFVVPNYVKALILSEEIPISARVEELMRQRFGYVQDNDVTYSSWTWAAWFVVMLAAVAVQLLPGRRDAGALLLLGFALYYSLVLPPLAASCLRYTLLVVPIILIGAWRSFVPAPPGSS